MRPLLSSIIGRHRRHVANLFGVAIGLVLALAGQVRAQCVPDQERAKITASDGTAGDWFGTNLALDGDELVVGVGQRDEADPSDSGCNSGAAYVYRFDPATGTWPQRQKLLSAVPTCGEYFGRTPALQGDRLLLGSEYADDGTGLPVAGAVFTFEKDALTGDWSPRPMIVADDVPEGRRFGRAVALDGDTAAVGAFWGDGGLGAAYVFRLDAADDTWDQVQKLTSSDGSLSVYFGSRLSLSGDTLFVRGTRDTQVISRWYVFERDTPAGPWTERQVIALDGGQGHALDGGV